MHSKTIFIKLDLPFSEELERNMALKKVERKRVAKVERKRVVKVERKRVVKMERKRIPKMERKRMPKTICAVHRFL